MSCLAAASPAEVVQLPLRVHVVRSAEPTMDGAEVVTQTVVRDRLREINRIFAPAGISWRLESYVVETPSSDTALRQAIETQRRPAALRSLVSAPSRLSPAGFDLYVVRTLSGVGIGGAYLCSVDGEVGHGAAFIGAEDGRGRPLPVRKWAHELGHSLGLPHAPCEPAYAGQLMTSGMCELAAAGREALSDDEIARMRAVALTGSPSPCGRGRDDGGD